ncbi:MAG: T9SS type A sorting domain-containing protein [Sphingobacteriales bacterium]|nr:MAG: T9SS type A sorting domain-containing protein [Sphingobacteriales bacterium]
MMAQEEMCYTSSDYPNGQWMSGNSTNCNESDNKPYYLSIVVNVIRRSDGSYDRTLSEVYEALDLLQTPFETHNIYFRLKCLKYIDDDDLYNQSNQSAVYCVDGLSSCPYPNFSDLFDEEALTIFVYPKGTPNEFGGGFGFSSGIPGNGLLVKGIWRSTTYDINGNLISEEFINVFTSSILAHETGHCLGLFHTFHGLCGESGCVETITPETDPENPCECGDFVTDTSADPGLSDGTIDDETCELITLLGCLEVIPPGYDPLIDNIMSYVGPTCAESFTNGQSFRMKEYINNATVVQNYVLPNSEVNTSLIKNWFAEQILPAGTTNWTHQINILGKITVPSGATLHIREASVYFEDLSSGIVVQKGGVLLIDDNSILKGNICNNSIWNGILLEGDANEPIPSSEYTSGMVFEHHGIARLQSNVTIENARTGIQVGDFIEFGGSGDNNTYGGGALFIEDTNFNNNSVGVYLLSQYAGDNLLARFKNCTFNFNAPFPGTHRLPGIGYAGIYTIRPFVVSGCIFQNTDPSGFFAEERGSGIISNRYGGWVVPSLSGTPTVFGDLYKGIDAYATGSLQSGLFVTGNLFERVTKGITLNGNTVSVISHNDFTKLDKDSYAVYAIGTRGIVADNNTVTVSVPPGITYEKPFGIAVRNSGIAGALVINNTFEADDPMQTGTQRFRAATQTEGTINPNVLIDCNNFTALSDFDIRIYGSPDFQDQGGCDPADLTLNPTVNNWHNIAAAPSGTNHILYDNATETLEVTYLPGHEPTEVSANVGTDICNFDENDCESFVFEGWEMEERIEFLQERMEQSTSGYEYERFYTELMRAYLQNNMLTEAKAETQARNDTEGLKILIATYTDERKLALADSLLQTLPLQTPEDADFYDFFSAYLYELWNNTDLMPYEGKALSPAAMQIQNMAANDNPNSRISLFAQAATATKQNSQYHRTPADFKTTLTANIVTKDALQIVPNPAQNEVFVSLLTNNWEKISSLNVYSLTGKLLQTLPLNGHSTFKPVSINTQNLGNGLYICQLIAQSGKTLTGKLVVAR